jgi:hypothetical protein
MDFSGGLESCIRGQARMKAYFVPRKYRCERMHYLA